MRRSDGFWGSSQDLLRLCLWTMLLAYLGGGGTRHGLIGDLIVQLAGLILLVEAGRRLTWSGLTGAQRLTLGAIAIVVVYGCFVSIPVGFGWWSGQSGRADYAAALTAASAVPTALPLSLAPYATEATLWTLLPAVAVLLATWRLDRVQLERLSLAIVAAAVVNVLVGFAQIAGGPDSPLRLYTPTNVGEAVGLFANRNHFASLLLMAMPLAAVHLVVGMERQREQQETLLPSTVFAGLALGLMILGLIVARSRAGLLLGMLCLIGVFALLLRRSGMRAGGSAVGLVAFLAIGLGLQLGLYGMFDRLGADPLHDERLQFARVGAHLASSFLPWGTGPGAFVAAFEHAMPAQDRLAVIANHVHDDWLELLIEWGLPGAVLALLGLALILALSVHAWRRGGAAATRLLLPRAASLSLLLVLAHSLVDYPLRPTANLVTFAALLGFVFAAARADWLAVPVPTHSTHRMASWRYENHQKQKGKKKTSGIVLPAPARPGTPPRKGRP